MIVSTKEAKPRGLYTTEKNVREHGLTRGCGGCSSIALGLPRQPHNDACRTRFTEILRGQAKTVNAERRKRELIDRELGPEAKNLKIAGSSGSVSKPEDTQGGQKRAGSDIEDLHQEQRTSDQQVDDGTRVGVKRERETSDQPAEEEVENPSKWWRSDDLGDEALIGQVELQDHLQEVWEKVGGHSLEKWIAEVRQDLQSQEKELELDGDESVTAYDNVHGGEISVKDLRAARKEEVEFMKARGIWKERPMEECGRKTGRMPVSVRWVDVNKGTDIMFEIRSLLIARGF